MRSLLVHFGKLCKNSPFSIQASRPDSTEDKDDKDRGGQGSHRGQDLDPRDLRVLPRDVYDFGTDGCSPKVTLRCVLDLLPLVLI